MLDRKNIHNAAMLEPDTTKQAETIKPKKKGKRDGLRQRPIHNSISGSDVSK